jgi:hypothetical protein
MTFTGPRKDTGYLPKNIIGKGATAAKADVAIVPMDLMLKPA